MMKLVFAQSIFYQACIHVVKSSIIIQYFRIFSSNTIILIACHILLFLVMGAATWGILGVVFMCLPVRKYWDIAIPGTCMDPHDHFLSSASIGIVLDFAIWVLPMPVIGRMQLPGRQKAWLMAVFGLGGFVCATSVLRLVLVWTAAEAGNVTKSGTAAVIWSSVEINVAIICASLLAMKPLFVRLFPRLMVATPTSYGETRQLRADSMGWRGLLGLGLSRGGAEGENSLASPVGTSVGSRDQGSWAGRST
ncbi:hypothetical protein BCR34DRAFT_552696 [Clohesyomyces aquaticus]|uniref:Rhodopsin domain-containing protein n=1 Tax=Clohesyomyces aquaticus TaxID=1231657 RepID=A0A1Y2A9R1_9PLEO|nr:hypothetical protein BCR34DRAFT_552696 [Clohesyomyces aquaticus]